jgi:DNA repair protein RecN (Recombination protein N)
MLRLLRVKNLALMEDVTVDFENGFTAVTGETGAGKSMIVEAVATLCGNRMEDVLIRSGKDAAEVTGIFQIPPAVRERLKETGIEVDTEIVVRRKIERGKRQNAYINDQIVSISLLKEITQDMVDLIGQYENQSLFSPKNHLTLLDSFAGVDNEKAVYRRDYNTYVELKKKLEQLQAAVVQRVERIDYLRYQINEIEKLNLTSGEEECLEEEKKMLLSTEKRASLTSDMIMHLYDAEGAAIEHLSKAKRSLDELASYDTSLAKTRKRFENLLSSVDDIYRELSSYASSIEFSQERLDEVIERLDAIGRVKKKFGKTFEDIQQHLVDMKKELTQIESHDEAIAETRTQITTIEAVIQKQAAELSSHRRKAAASLTKKILGELVHLGMKKARFKIELTSRDLDESGADSVEFYISTNPGEELKPLRKVASGGEISRITLSLKTILSAVDKIPTLIFDEVDTGIGGSIAEAVGELLAKVSRHHQIICITHLPQISIFADNHMLVEKEIKGSQTFTKISKLDKDKRKMEIARMLGGKEITQKTVEHAAEFLQKGRAQ